MDLLHIINATNNQRCKIADAPATKTAAMGSWNLATATMGSWKPDLDLWWNAALRVNSFDATLVTVTTVPLGSCSLITKNTRVAADTSTLHEFPSAFRNDTPALPPMEAAGGSAPLKPKRRRLRPSRRVPTTVVKKDTSNFKAMVDHFIGIPPTCSPVTTHEPTTPPSDSTSSATSPSFSKPLPHSAFCKMSSSCRANAKTTVSAPITTCPSPLLSSSFTTRHSLLELPSISTVVTLTGFDQIPKSADMEEHTNLPNIIDVALFEKLLNEINIERMGRSF